jgi:hypothetical protein
MVVSVFYLYSRDAYYGRFGMYTQQSTTTNKTHPWTFDCVSVAVLTPGRSDLQWRNGNGSFVLFQGYARSALVGRHELDIRSFETICEVVLDNHNVDICSLHWNIITQYTLSETEADVGFKPGTGLENG